MKEIEVKILETSHKDLESKLLELGAKKVSDQELNAIFFDNKTGDIEGNNQTLRLRKEGDVSFLTHKRKIKGASEDLKIREETEIEVSSFEDTKKILEILGYNEFKSITKRRISYKLDDIKFEFDIHKGAHSHIPEFLELEAENIDIIHKYVELLGLKKEDCKPWSVNELVKHYKK